MPSRNSSDSSKGRGRSRRSGDGSNFEGKRSSRKGGDRSDKRNNEGPSFSKRTSRPTRPGRFKDSGGNSERRSEGPSFSRSSTRPSRSERPGGGEQKSDKKSGGTSYSKYPNRAGRSERPKDGGENKGHNERRSYSKYSKGPNRSDSSNRSRGGFDTPSKEDRGNAYPKRSDRQDRPGKFKQEGSPSRGNWRKSFSDDAENKRDFKGRKRDSGETFDSDKRAPYPKFDKGHFRKKSGQPPSAEKKVQSDAQPADGKIRLNKFIANSGVCSRREADELIKIGLISVNGIVITELGHKVNPSDEIRHEGKLLRREKPVYILMNKPKGFLTTTADPEERNTVMHLIANHVKERVYPVGRLDRNTTGLLLLTNDGDLAEKLMHPSYNVKKIYKVDLDRPLTKADAQRIVDGVRLEEGVAMVDDLAVISDDRKTVGLEIHIGWNRVVRRIFEALEYEVLKLDRSVYAGLTKKDLGRGQWRFLKKEELVILKHLQ